MQRKGFEFGMVTRDRFFGHDLHYTLTGVKIYFVAVKQSKSKSKLKEETLVQVVEQPVMADEEGHLDPEEEKVLDWILKAVVAFILGWLGLAILMVIGGYFGIWG